VSLFQPAATRREPLENAVAGLDDADALALLRFQI
jgi:hypothetical protein